MSMSDYVLMGKDLGFTDKHKETANARRAMRDEYLARQHARMNLETTKQWVTQNSDLNKDIETCNSSSQSFSTEFSASIPKASELCEKIAADIHLPVLPSDFKTSCEFLENSPCKVELIKRFEFPFGALFDRSGLVDHSRTPSVEMKVRGSVVYLCEPVAVLGIVPKWICGAGSYVFGTYIDKDQIIYSEDEFEGLVPFAEDMYVHEFSKAASVKETMKVLKLMSLPN
jgi:hypothetical protein